MKSRYAERRRDREEHLPSADSLLKWSEPSLCQATGKRSFIQVSPVGGKGPDLGHRQPLSQASAGSWIRSEPTSVGGYSLTCCCATVLALVLVLSVGWILVLKKLFWFDLKGRKQRSYSICWFTLQMLVIICCLSGTDVGRSLVKSQELNPGLFE